MSPADASSYDQVPYASLALPQTHPDRLASIARIFRLSPPDVSACRVLELGCASGGNLLPMAFNLPGSEFVGIDTSRQQVEDAQAPIRASGVRNLRVEQASIVDIDDAWGRFDYIICHGVFSWVDASVQDAILRVCAENLSPAGVAYISYNTYPGWHMRQMVRDMMQYHAAQFSDPQEQVEQARAVLSFLATASRDSGPYGQFLTSEADRAARAADSYLFHEHLERTNIPIYFHQFADRAAGVGLQFLSEAVVSEMLTSHFGEGVAETLERISADLVHLEQYMDFIRNRQFRQTLLCHDAQRPVRALDAEALRGMRLSSAVSVEGSGVDLTPGTAVAFTTGSRRAEVSKPATKAAIGLLMDAWPRALAVDELCRLAIHRATPVLGDVTPDEAERGMLEDLFGAVMYGLVELHTQAPPCTNVTSDTPHAHPLAALQAKSSRFVANAHHQAIELDDLSRQVLTLANGRRRHGEMVDELQQAPETGREELEDRVEQVLATLTRNALLIA